MATFTRPGDAAPKRVSAKAGKVGNVTCPLCRKRTAKRACPALRQDICATCCATKRLVEIHCPEDCRFLENAQKHPAAVIRRQMDVDISLLMASLGRVGEQQLQLFFLLQTTILAHKPEAVARLTDTDVALATGALAASLESAAKGVIYEESTSNPVAESLRRVLKTIVEEIAKKGGSRAEREIAEVLRGIERGAKENGYLELVARVLQKPAPGTSPPPSPLLI